MIGEHMKSGLHIVITSVLRNCPWVSEGNPDPTDGIPKELTPAALLRSEPAPLLLSGHHPYAPAGHSAVG